VIHAVAFCPHPPLLLPDVAQGAASELDDLRAACRTALRQVCAAAPKLVVVGATDGPSRRHLPTERGSLAPYGVPLEIPLGDDRPGPVELPLSLTIGAWLLRDALGPNCGAIGRSVGAGESMTDSIDADVALIVMGDGSARRSTTAPGYLDDRAAAFDASVTAALANGIGAQLCFDERLAAELLAAGAPAWNATGRWLTDRTFDADLLYDDAPYGVGYFVATWTSRG
jgi:hypothetical protein